MELLILLAMIVFSVTVPPAVYFLPTLVAASRQHPDGWAIFVVNLFLGWTLIGWVVAFAWSVKN